MYEVSVTGSDVVYAASAINYSIIIYSICISEISDLN
jgi:hypothetical protein